MYSFSKAQSKKKMNSKSQSHSKISTIKKSPYVKTNYSQITLSQYHSLNKSQGHSMLHKKPSLSISTSSSITKQIASKKNATNHNRSFSINQSLNNSRVNLNLTTTSNHITNNIMKRKKILSVNVNSDLMFTDTNSKKNEPLKLYTENSGIVTETEKNEINSLKDTMKELEQKLSLNLSQNKTNSKSTKYNTIKGIFEELIKAFPTENQSLLIKLLKGYHEVVFAFANENRSLKEANEVKQNQYISLDKEQIELRKALKEKENEIELLKLKLKEKTSTDQISKSTNESGVVSSNGKDSESKKEEKRNTTEKIDLFNKNNIEDLDALYFYDKVKMNSDNKEAVPMLNFQFEEENKPKRRTINKSNLNNNSMINIKYNKLFK